MLRLTDRTVSIRSFGVASRYVEAKSEAHASLQIGFASRRPAFTCGVARRYAERMAQVTYRSPCRTCRIGGILLPQVALRSTHG
ncbi:MAG: hypothetical protein LBR08_05600 [Bacteroidales bacterium]|nr:hypothetical protein [Bacteroidales bacterium]